MSFEFLDIFGEPMKRTDFARKKEYKHVVSVLISSDKVARPDYLAKMAFLTSAGYLSGKSASYFLTGEVSPLQENVLSSFLDFLDSFNSSDIQISFKYLKLWHAKEQKEVVNTFLFPSEALASKDVLFGIDFENERLSYEL